MNPELEPTARGLRVAMALYGDLTYDSRVRREARSLAQAGHRVTVVCLASGDASPDLPSNVAIRVVRPPGRSVIPGSANPFFGPGSVRWHALKRRVGWLATYVRGLRSWGRLALEAAGEVDVWHAHDLTGLAAMAPNVRGRLPIVYDSHELFVETGTALRLPKPARLAIRAYERRLTSRVEAVVTVNEALANVFRAHVRGRPVLAVHNCADRPVEPVAPSGRLRSAAGISGPDPVLLYHGALSANRGIEQLMAALLEPGLESAHLVLLGYGELADALERASDDPRWAGRVHLLPPVPPHALLSWVADADVGVMPIQPSTLNHRLSTPNKLFECLAAGVPVVASDFPGMREIILGGTDGPLGAVCDPTDVADVARALRAVLGLAEPDRAALRARCRRVAVERWNWESEANRLLSLYAGIAARIGTR